MKSMNVKSILLGSVLICASLGAQTPLSGLTASLEGKLVSFDYSFKVKGDAPIMGSGTVVFKDGSFDMKGNGLEVCSDGKTRWTIDYSDKEVYIEDVAGDDVNYVSNPALLLASIEEAFEITGTKSSSVDGRHSTAVSLVPAVKGTGMTSAVIYVSGTTPLGLDVTIKDGTVTSFKLANYSLSDGDADFSFDIKSLDNSFSVTDLR